MKTRLTERDLNRIVRRIVREGVITGQSGKPAINTETDLSSYEGKTGTFKVDGGNFILYGSDGTEILTFLGTGLPIQPK